MRVTQNMLNSNMLRNVSNNLERMGKYQDQLSSGKRINSPSDDPVGTSFSLRYRSELGTNEQYQKNIDSTLSWLEYMDKIMGQTTDVLQRARDLAVQGANGTNPDNAMKSMAEEVSQLYEQLVDIGNSKFNGKYVFNGQMTDFKPYSVTSAPLEQTDDGVIRYQIGGGINMPVNLSGEEVFGDAGTILAPSNTNAFQILKDLETALNSGDYTETSNIIGRLDTRLDGIFQLHAEVGARTNRVQMAENRIKDIDLNLRSLISKTEDADMAEVITKLKTEENVYQASLSTGARIIQPSLVDFIK